MRSNRISRFMIFPPDRTLLSLEIRPSAHMPLFLAPPAPCCASSYSLLSSVIFHLWHFAKGLFRERDDSIVLLDDTVIILRMII